MDNKVNVGIIGAGNWGRNLVRNFSQLKEAELRSICDIDPQILQNMKALYPDVTTTSLYQDLLENEEIEAVVIATIAKEHYGLAKKALLADKDLFVEKPMTLSLEEAEELVELAEERKRILMVGHLLKYHPAVTMVKQLIERGELGEIYYLYSQRLNLGQIRRDENSLWSFAPHDISVILYLLDDEPIRVNATGGYYIQKGIEDVTFLNLHFRDRKMAQIHVSWLDPHRVRKLTVVGSKKMVVFDDVEAMEKVKIFDKGVGLSAFPSYEEVATLRFGDIYIPRVDMTEPLRLECQHFLDCVRERKVPRSDGRDGLRVIKVLEAAQLSLEGRGVPVDLSISLPRKSKT
ncbi:MAG: Gfo/Idh/MocA family oxidoreductase [Candidatus Tectomicrobia bacterium]|nr:Gfo/Idh/MocA family oxidoreductase [Candidatus Tectomicrobia bacterium]